VKVLITGGTGFIGSRLAARCLDRAEIVTVLGEANTEAEAANRADLERAGAQVVLASVTDKDALREALREVDVVFHLAAAQHEMNIPDRRFREVNVEGTRNVIDASIEAGVTTFLHGSTIGVYGALEGVIDEESPCDPDNIYGVTKLEGERLALSYGDRLPVVAVRIPEVYGPGDRRLLKLFRALQRRKFITIGTGENLHHLIYVDDLIDGFFGAVKNPDTRGEVFLLSGEMPLSTDEMVGTIAEELGVPAPRFHFPFLPFWLVAFALEKTCRPLGIQPPLHRRRMDFFKKSFQLSHEKASRVYGFRPKTPFAEGVAATARWYMDAGLIDRSRP
jgi:nucleoside-diphosphate-sugar epimerase